MAKNNITDYDHKKARSLPVPAGTKSGDVVNIGDVTMRVRYE